MPRGECSPSGSSLIGSRVASSSLLRAVSLSVSLGLLLSAIVGVGCGPSFEAIQEGGLRFAHCDRLDLDRNIAPSHRLHCWREWRRVYTYGQTRDRVDYSRRRIAVLVSGDTAQPFSLPEAGERKLVVSCPEACNAQKLACAAVCSTAAAGCGQCAPQFRVCRELCS